MKQFLALSRPRALARWCVASLAAVNAAACAQQIYSNGSPDAVIPALALTTRSISGVNAPTSSSWSETPGTATEVNMMTGFSCYSETPGAGSSGSFRLADDFTVTALYGWHLSSVTFYVYSPGYSGSTSPVSRANIRVWSGPPDATDKVLLFGDTTTNRLLSCTATSAYRIFNSRPLPTATPPGTTRRIWAVTVNLTVASVAPLYDPGTYWFDVQMVAADPNAMLFCVPASNAGVRSSGNANAMGLAYTGLAPVWEPLVDVGKPFLLPEAPQDLAFVINGDTVDARCPADFNQDGGIDGADVEDFFSAWSSGSATADVNGDGGIDGSDVGVFFRAWENGGC